jgi:hypothetical protein
MIIKKTRRKVESATLSLTRIEVTGFNDLDSQILDKEEHSLNNGRRCINDNRGSNVIGWYSLDSEGVVEKGS